MTNTGFIQDVSILYLHISKLIAQKNKVDFGHRLKWSALPYESRLNAK